MGQFIMPAQISLPVIVEMPVGIDLGRIAEQDEQIGVAPVLEVRLRLAAQILVHRREPGLYPLPRRIVAVELIGAVRTVAVCEKQAGGAESRLRRAERT